MFSNVKYIMTDQMYVYTKKINLTHSMHNFVYNYLSAS